jgi:hypothetical protein
LEQIISLYFILGNFSSKIFSIQKTGSSFNSLIECLEYIRIGYDRVATYQSIYDFGQTCLCLLQKAQPSMKIFIEKMFQNEIESIIYDEKLVEELEGNIRKFKEKLFRKKNLNEERRSLNENISIEK